LEQEIESNLTQITATAAEEQKERSYQSALLEIAIERNSIVCLPTGSGKTLIAVQLAKHFLRDETK
jgi:ERCC4-related helicase